MILGWRCLLILKGQKVMTWSRETFEEQGRELGREWHSVPTRHCCRWHLRSTGIGTLLIRSKSYVVVWFWGDFICSFSKDIKLWCGTFGMSPFLFSRAFSGFQVWMWHYPKDCLSLLSRLCMFQSLKVKATQEMSFFIFSQRCERSVWSTDHVKCRHRDNIDA